MTTLRLDHVSYMSTRSVIAHTCMHILMFHIIFFSHSKNEFHFIVHQMFSSHFVPHYKQIKAFNFPCLCNSYFLFVSGGCHRPLELRVHGSSSHHRNAIRFCLWGIYCAIQRLVCLIFCGMISFLLNYLNCFPWVQNF